MISPDFLRRQHAIVGLLTAVALTLSGCATPGPASPNVLALPAPGESFSLFQQHETTCRQYAAAQTGGQSPGQAATKSGVGGALLGTGLGAAVGALFGSASGHAGTGAAIGAGGGLLAGSIVGEAHGQQAGEATQNHYDMSYSQCMVASGERIQPPADPVLYAPPPRVVYVAPPVYVPAPVYAPSPIYALPPGSMARPPS